ncbi:GNAT family N-acetyltransferase [Candidatus Woesearchaeota archaeon]|nr:GNAT family N-acetyltransferase [Candidatus Woesearchaeota archaeon]
MNVPLIRGNRVVLRKIASSDLDLIVSNLNDRIVNRFLSTIPFPYSLKDARYFVSRVCTRKDHACFGIESVETGIFMGVISLSRINVTHRKAALGYWIGRKYWNRGFGTEAVKLILGFAFGKLGLKRVYAKVMTKNSASMRLLVKAGFKHEGTLRKDILKKGRFVDMELYGLLNGEHRVFHL